MPTDRTEINRANAQLSTGPKTEEGKQRSRFNARKHNLTGQTLISSEEDLQNYFDCSARLIADLRPEGEFEKRLAQSLADAQWQLDRARAIETNLLFQLATPHLPADADATTPIDWAEAQAKAFAENSKQLDLMSRYATRFHRQVLQIHAALIQVQKDRRLYDQKRNQQRHDRQREALAGHQSNAAGASNQTTNQPNGFVSQDRQTNHSPKSPYHPSAARMQEKLAKETTETRY